MRDNWKAAIVLQRRIRLSKALGLQMGTLYAKRREKLSKSYGYLRDGNLRHYVACYPKRPIHVKGKRFVTKKESDLLYVLMDVSSDV